MRAIVPKGVEQLRHSDVGRRIHAEERSQKVEKPCSCFLLMGPPHQSRNATRVKAWSALLDVVFTASKIAKMSGGGSSGL